MIRDALVLRHRLPLAWERVLAHQVPVWRARRIAQAVAGRPDDVASHLDRALAPVAEKVGPVIVDRLIDEAMMLLYPEQRELAQVEALDARYVRLHEESLTETGVGDLTIRGDWKDLHDFSQTLSEIAARLLEEDAAEDREPDSLDVRRSRAVGVLADPQAAAALLAGRPAPGRSGTPCWSCTSASTPSRATGWWAATRPPADRYWPSRCATGAAAPTPTSACSPSSTWTSTTPWTTTRSPPGSTPRSACSPRHACSPGAPARPAVATRTT
jgi:hypothetical protein